MPNHTHFFEKPKQYRLSDVFQKKISQSPNTIDFPQLKELHGYNFVHFANYSNYFNHYHLLSLKKQSELTIYATEENLLVDELEMAAANIRTNPSIGRSFYRHLVSEGDNKELFQKINKHNLMIFKGDKYSNTHVLALCFKGEIKNKELHFFFTEIQETNHLTFAEDVFSKSSIHKPIF